MFDFGYPFAILIISSGLSIVRKECSQPLMTKPASWSVRILVKAMFRGGSVRLVYGKLKAILITPHYQSKNRKLQLVAKDQGGISYQNKLLET